MTTSGGAMASSKMPAAKGSGLTLEDAVCMVVEQGLAPQHVLILCNHGNPGNVRPDALSRAVSRAVKERVDQEVGRALRAAAERRRDGSREEGVVDADASEDDAEGAAALLALAGGSPGPEGAAAAASSVTRASKRGTKRKTPPTPSAPSFTLKPTFTAPYLKGGLPHFQKKVQAGVRKALKKQAESPPSPEVTKRTKDDHIITRDTSYQRNVKWQKNANADATDLNKRYSDAFKEATQKVADVRDGKIPATPSKTQQRVVDDANAKYKLSGEGKENSREQKKLTVRTVVRAVDNGLVGQSPQKKGRGQKISRNLLKLMALHANMEQVGDRGELDSSEIKAILDASVIDTDLEGTFSLDYAWEQCRKENADILVPVGVKQAEDIRWKWVTYEKLNQYFTDLKALFLKYKFAFDRPETLQDGTSAEITMNPLLKSRQIWFDETEIRLGNDRDNGGPRSKTHTNPLLNRGGARSTRSCHHVTAGMAATAAGEVLPPLFIFSSTAQNEENMAVNDAWIEGMGYTRGRYGHRDHIKRMPYIAVRPTGSMCIGLFQQYVEDCTYDLYPKETVSLEVKVNEHGVLVSGPVLWGSDTGPGRISANTDDGLWDEWALKMRERGIIMVGLLPNSTTVSAILDELFRAFKGAIRKQTQKVFARKVKANARQVKALKADIAARRAAGETVSAGEQAKVNVVASLDPRDLSEIFFGKLGKDGFAAPDSPFAMHFTSEKILRAYEKLGFQPFTRKLLENPKVRHEVGQGEETDQTTMMQQMRDEYEALKMTCHSEGYDVTVFDAELATTSCLLRGQTAEERAQALAESGRTASAGGMFRFLSTMMYNGEEVLRAREIERDNRAKARQDKSDEQDAEGKARYKAAYLVYVEYRERGSQIDQLLKDELYDLIKFIVPEEGKSDVHGKKEAPSHFTTVVAMKTRLASCDPAWTIYFDPDGLDASDGAGAGEPPAATGSAERSATATTALEEAIESAVRSAEGIVDPVCLQRAIDAGFTRGFVLEKAKIRLEIGSQDSSD